MAGIVFFFHFSNVLHYMSTTIVYLDFQDFIFGVVALCE